MSINATFTCILKNSITLTEGTYKYNDIFQVANLDDEFILQSTPGTENLDFLEQKGNLYLKSIVFDLINAKGVRDYTDNSDLQLNFAPILIASPFVGSKLFIFPGWGKELVLNSALKIPKENSLQDYWRLYLQGTSILNFINCDTLNLQDEYKGRECFVRATLKVETAV